MAEGADFFLRTPTLTASNFETLWPRDPRFLSSKDLNPFLILSKFQETSSILMVGYAMSEWPYFHRAYLVTVCSHLTISVFLPSLPIIVYFMARLYQVLPANSCQPAAYPVWTQEAWTGIYATQVTDLTGILKPIWNSHLLSWLVYINHFNFFVYIPDWSRGTVYFNNLFKMNFDPFIK